jgi:hypothetical protein
MRRMSIQQFREDLAGRSDQSTLVRAYRALARRPEAAARMVVVEWVTWPPAAAPAMAA